jgi:hypothetical protein
MPPKAFAIYAIIVTTCFTASIGVTCVLTLVLLRKRGQLRRVQVMFGQSNYLYIQTYSNKSLIH